MFFVSVLFLLLSPSTRAGPLNAWPRQNNVTTHSTASTLIITATAGNSQPVTFTPNRVTNPAIWNIQSTTVITTSGIAETIYPSGYEWVVASPSPNFPVPPIPANAPYPVPADSTTGSNILLSAHNSGFLSLGTGTISSSFSLGTGNSKSVPLGTGSILTRSSTSTSNSVPLGTDFTRPTVPITTGGTAIPSSATSGSNSTGRSSSPTSNDGSSVVSTSRASAASGSQLTTIPSQTGSGSMLSHATTRDTPTGGATTSPTAPTSAFPTYHPPSSTIDPPAATSEADRIGPLLVDLWRNRDMVKDNRRKEEYIDNVQKVRDDIVGLFNNLEDKGPPAPTKCGKTVAKRSRPGRALVRKSLVSGIMNTLDNVAKLLSCATKVAENLVDKVKIPEPPISEIETLTDMLNDLGSALDSTNQEPSNNPSSSQSNSASSIQSSRSSESRSSSSSSCSSSAAPVCTQTVSLSTLFSADGTRTTSSIQSITTSSCSTITGCDVQPSTSYTTNATTSATSTETFVCGTGCAGAACTPQPTKRSVDSVLAQKMAKSNERRSLDPLDDWKGEENNYVQMIVEKQTSTELDWNFPGFFIVSQHQKFDKQAQANYVAGVTGCLVILIITERGMWMAHIIEAAFRDNKHDKQNYQGILNTIRDGANHYTKPDTLTSENDVLDLTHDPRIYVMAPKEPNGGEIYPSQNAEILDALFGAGTPFAHVTRLAKPYVKPQTESELYRQGAFGKLLAEYDPDQHNEDGETQNPRQAMWRLWFQQNAVEHPWTACTALQKRQGTCPRGSATGSSAPSVASSSRSTGTGTSTSSLISITVTGTVTPPPASSRMESRTSTGPSPIVIVPVTPTTSTPTTTRSPSDAGKPGNCPDGCSCGALATLCA